MQYAVVRNPFRTLEPLTADYGRYWHKEHHCTMLFLNALHLVTGYYTYPEHTPIAVHTTFGIMPSMT
jgi:hypothetical protein